MRARALNYHATVVIDRDTCTPCRRLDDRQYASRAAASVDFNDDGEHRFCEGDCVVGLWAVLDDEIDSVMRGDEIDVPGA